MPIPVSLIANINSVACLFLFPAFYADNYFAAFGEFYCVTDQVDDDLPQPAGVANKRFRQIRLHFVHQFQAFLMSTEAQRAHGFAEAFSQVERNRFETQRFTQIPALES